MGRKRKSQLMKLRRVAVMISVHEHTYGYEKIGGIIDYYSRHSAWDIYRNEWGQPIINNPQELKAWDGDGIIGEVYDEKTADLISALGIPFVNTASADLGGRFPGVMLNNRLIGKIAAEHLIELKLDQFAFVGPQNHWYAHERCKGFSDAIKSGGGECCSFFYDVNQSGESHVPRDMGDLDALRETVKKLPRPIGILAASDRVGFAILEACRKLGISSPEEVSLIGVNNDSIFCQMAMPSMSSVDVSAHQVGFTAAQMLDDLMEERPLKKSQVLVAPNRIIPRNSTDMTRSEFPEVARALRFIRLHDREFIDVNDVMAVVPVSRRWLELKFKQEVGWGIYHEIRRVRVERAKHLLETTDWPVSRIASESGFKTAQQFDEAFKKLVGMVGREYRQKHKSGKKSARK